MKTEPIDEIQTIENIEAATDNIESNSFKPEPAKWRSRFVGFFTDAFPIAVLSSVIATELGDPDLKQVFFIMIYIPYCLICEGIFNRTIGKLITDTIVVDSKRFSKPSFGQILGRTFSRLIPFDGLSFISSRPNGWHDSISNTMVVSIKSMREFEEFNNKFNSKTQLIYINNKWRPETIKTGRNRKAIRVGNLKFIVMRTMSIIGIVWFSLSLLLMLFFFENDIEASVGWGMLGLLYAIPYAIVGLNKAKKIDKESYETQKSNVVQELIALNELKEKGILSEDEFQAKKKELL